MPSSRKDHLIDSALALFNREGYHATGIDRILAEAGVAKMTLYNHFRSKDDLILAALRRRDERFRNWFVRSLEARATTPKERLLAVFDVLGQWFEQEDFWGCMFINAAAEYSRKENPIHAACAEHKRLLRDHLAELAAGAGARDPATLARRLMLLVEGATVTAHVCGDRGAAADAKALAEDLIERELPVLTA